MNLLRIIASALQAIHQPTEADERTERTERYARENHQRTDNLALRVQAIENQQRTQQDEATRKNNERWRFECRRFNLELGLNLFTLVLVGVTAGFTGWLAVTTSDMATTARDSLESVQRAFVNLEVPTRAVKVITDDGTVEAHFNITWRNAGNSPAKNVSTRWANRSRDSSLAFPNIRPALSPEEIDDGPPSSLRVLVLGPGAMTSQEVYLPVRARDRERLWSIWGWVTYDDIFDDTPIRLTEYCIEIRGITAAPGTNLTDPSGDLIVDTGPCPGDFNCYDEDCPDYQNRADAERDIREALRPR